MNGIIRKINELTMFPLQGLELEGAFWLFQMGNT